MILYHVICHVTIVICLFIAQEIKETENKIKEKLNQRK